MLAGKSSIGNHANLFQASVRLTHPCRDHPDLGLIVMKPEAEARPEQRDGKEWEGE